MTAAIKRIAAALLAALGTNASAEYRCDPAPTRMDRNACEAARQGPEELRRFVQRMNWMKANLYFYDYVDPATVRSGDARAERHAAQVDLNKSAANEIAAESRR